MLDLLILRHAEANENRPGEEDIDRPLTPLGQIQAKSVGKEIRRSGLIPTFILSSGSRRTRETLAILLPYLEGNISVQLDNALYLADEDLLVDQLTLIKEGRTPLMFIGHSPGIKEFTKLLAGHGDAKIIDGLTTSFPTAALVILSFNLDKWCQVTRGAGRLVRLSLPSINEPKANLY